MTGLILKDLMILRKTLRSYLLVAVVYAAIALSGQWSAEFVGVFMMVMVSILPMNVFAYDKQCKWDTYCLALPVGRTKTVAARYVCVLLLCLLSMGLAAAIGAAMHAAGRLSDPMDFMLICSVMGVVTILVNAFILPCLYKFGPERARMMFMGITGSIFVGIIAFAKVFGGAEWLDSLGEPTQAQIAAIPVIAVLAGLALLALSFLLSRHFYGSKDV